ncbi:hypothetical protein EB061_12000 [bacterium]|nr:hypothetical protein [bacterium]
MAAPQLFQDQVEKDLVLKRALPIYVNHRLGDVSIQGWVQDRIRVTLKYRGWTETEALARTEFAKLALVTFEGRDQFEIRVGHPQGVDLVTKMRDRARSSIHVDLEIKAPYQSALALVLGEGQKLELEHWRGPVSLTGKNSQLEFSRLDLARELTLSCIPCQVDIRDSSLKGRLVVGSKPVQISQVKTSGLSIDAGNEEVRVERSEGRISVHTKGGRLNVNRFKGKVEFQSEDGAAFLNQLSGTAEVQTQSGQIMLDLDEVNGPVHLDTERSDIQVSLQPHFEGAIDLLSLRGEVIVQFPYEALKTGGSERYGPVSPGRVNGMIGNRTSPLIHAFSKQGGVRLIRKAPAR